MSDSQAQSFGLSPSGCPDSLSGAVSCPVAGLIRAAADGELGRDDLARLDAGDPALSQRVEFERTLRLAVGRAMGRSGGPGGLQARVRAAIAADAEERQPRTLALRPFDTPAGPGSRRLLFFALLALAGIGGIALYLALNHTSTP